LLTRSAARVNERPNSGVAGLPDDIHHVEPEALFGAIHHGLSQLHCP
jgi:hypothetical protein